MDDRARAIAHRVGLGAVLDRLPATLPFADLRRLELAKAIGRDPKVVLVDEPFAGLTPGEVGVFSDLIASFRDEGRAVLLVDHNVKGVAALVDRVLAMYLGEPIAAGTAEQVMRRPEGAPGLSRRRHRGRGPARASRQIRPAAAGRGRRRRAVRQGAGAAGRLDPRARGRVRLAWSG